MSKTIVNIQVLYDRLGSGEKKIADFLMKTPKSIFSLSITDLARQCQCGEATITRFAKRLGFNGYQQLKIAIAQDEKAPKVYEKINENDNAAIIFNKVCEDIYLSLEKTKAGLNKQQLNDFCNCLLSKRHVYIFGLGNSASVAMDATHKLSRLGLHATVCTDNHMQAIISSHVDEGCLVLGISHSGRSKDIIQALQIAKRNNAVTACITDRSKSPIFKVSDYVLTTVADETNYRILGLNSRIAQLAIIDTIYYFLACHIPQSKEIMHQTEKALIDKKN